MSAIASRASQPKLDFGGSVINHTRVQRKSFPALHFWEFFKKPFLQQELETRGIRIWIWLAPGPQKAGPVWFYLVMWADWLGICRAYFSAGPRFYGFTPWTLQMMWKMHLGYFSVNFVQWKDAGTSLPSWYEVYGACGDVTVVSAIYLGFRSRACVRLWPPQTFSIMHVTILGQVANTWGLNVSSCSWRPSAAQSDMTLRNNFNRCTQQELPLTAKNWMVTPLF